MAMYRDYENNTKLVPIDFTDSSIAGLLETVFSLQYFANAEEAIYDLLTAKDFVNEMSLEQFASSFDLASDASKLTDLITYVLDLIVSPYFDYASDIKSNMDKFNIEEKNLL